MKSLDELDHYEVLEVMPGARYEEIERAYHLTRAAYAEGSMALYSLFSSADAEVIRGRIDEAYRVLANPDDRKSYDEAEGISSQPGESPDDGSVNDFSLSSGGGAATGTVQTTIDVFEELDAEIDEDEREFGGAALRRARLRRGVELKQIAAVTKISRTHLGRIEDEDFADLPASVYVRGFVVAYARAIGLDSDRIATSYMERLNAARGPGQESGVPGRR